MNEFVVQQLGHVAAIILVAAMFAAKAIADLKWREFSRRFDTRRAGEPARR